MVKRRGFFWLSCSKRSILAMLPARPLRNQRTTICGHIMRQLRDDVYDGLCDGLGDCISDGLDDGFGDDVHDGFSDVSDLAKFAVGTKILRQVGHLIVYVAGSWCMHTWFRAWFRA